MTDSVDDEYEGHSAMELWLHDLSVDSATRVAGGLMIFIGSLLGLLLGIALISANVGEVLSGQLDGSDGVADVNGIVSTALQDSGTGGDRSSWHGWRSRGLQRRPLSEDMVAGILWPLE